MWAVCRSANPFRCRGHRIVVASSWCAKSDTINDMSKPVEWDCEGSGFVTPDNILSRSSCNGPSVHALLFLGEKNFSSQAGAKSGDNDDDLEDGFSDLEIGPEANSLADSAGRGGDGGLLSEGDTSEEDLAEDADDSLDLHTEVDAKIEKASKGKSLTSPLFKILMDSPRHATNVALDKWVEEGNAMSRAEIAIAMLNLRKWRFYGKALQFMEWLEANKRLEFVERDYASQLDLTAKVHGLSKAEKYIEKIPKPFRGNVIYGTLLANCVSASNVKKAEEVFNKIRDLGFPITIFVCNQLLLLYKRLDRKKIADVLLMMEKENVKPSHFTYGLLIDSKGRLNDISGMEQIVESMKAEGVEPDLNIQAMVARYYISAGHEEKAKSMLKEMEGDVKETRNAWKALLPLYAALGNVEDVERIWKACEVNTRLDECYAVIEAWGHLGHVENAERVFEHMLKVWKKLSTKYYNVMLKVYAKHKLLSKGKELAKRMSDSGCKIGPLTWDALVKLYVEAGEVEKADSILQKASQQNPNRPLYSSYITVLDKYAKRGDVHNAEKIFHRLRQTGYTVRISQYQALLQAYINAKTPAYGFRQRMKADNMFPNKAVAGQLAAVDAFTKSPMSDLLD